MKTRLKQIYQDVSDGKLTQNEALDKIRTLKFHEENKDGVLLSFPNWTVSNLTKTSDANTLIFEQLYVTLFEFPNINLQEINKEMTSAKVLSIQLAGQKNSAERYHEAAQNCFDSVKKILTKKPLNKTLFQIVIPNNKEEALLIGLSGLLQSVRVENPNLIGQIVVVPSDINTLELVELLKINKNSYQDNIIKHENGVRKVLRLKEIQTASKTPTIVFKEKGTYLITGGLGGLGILIANEIANQTHDATIILVGRSKLKADKKKSIDLLLSRGINVEYQQVDIGNLEQVTQLVNGIKSKYKQLNGIIHCAGIHKDNFTLKKSTEEFRSVLQPKVDGTYNLDEASKELDIDFMVLFSSVASWLGNVGQTDYAVGNGFLDQFSIYRNQLVSAGERKGKTVSINWPLWKDGGMTIAAATSKIISESTGLQSLETSKGMHSFYRSLELPYGQIMVTYGNKEIIRKQIIEKQPISQKKTTKSKTVDKKTNIETLFQKAQDFISNELAVQLKIASHRLDAQTPLEKYGIDSILSMNLTNQLEKTFGSLPKTLFFEYLTIYDLTTYFIKSHPETLNALFNDNEEEQTQEQNVEPSEKPLKSIASRQMMSNRFIRRQQIKASSKKAIKDNYIDDPIAIIGLSGRYSEAKDISEYWENLRDGKDCIVEVPKERWDWREYYTEDRTKNGHHYSKWGGFISGADEFDPRFFNISPREAKIIDPQERLFLQHTWMAVEDAGYTRDSLQISDDQDLAGQVGVYVGVMYGEYQLFGVQGKPKGLINSYASIANRVSYVLNLHGPSMTLDTMCSSSLTAIHLACQDLKLGRTNMAIAGGVNLSIHPNKYLFLSASQFVSSNGHCESFGEGGDGYIPGEGVGVVILKRLSEAKKDGDHIYGVIKGSSLNHGGKTNGYSVPNPKAQSAAISRAITESKIDPRHISYIEAHGTGTKLGDPIEIRALDQAFKKYTEDNGYCLIGSAKSNVGHCESAAAIAGITKVLLQMQHKQIVPSLHSAKLNPYIDFKSTPFIVNQTLKDWKQPIIKGRKIPRIAGVSSFGAGGSNAHIIIEEYNQSIAVSKPSIVINSDQTFAVPLSARTVEQLKQKTVDLLTYIENKQLELNEIVYTLQVGREAMAERLGFVVNSKNQLVSKLKEYIKGETRIEDTYQGKINSDGLAPLDKNGELKQIIEESLKQHNNQKILELWTRGFNVDWNKLYPAHKPKRITLPTYPFAKEKYWVDIEKTAQTVSVSIPSKVIHPLLHSNTSDFTQQSYSSVFNGDEFVFLDSQIKSGDTQQKMLSTSAYLEMASVAIKDAMSNEEATGIIKLQNVVCGQPFINNKEKQITIALFSKTNNQVDFEIYSDEEKEETIHCQGSAMFNQQSTAAKLKIEQLKLQMSNEHVVKQNFSTKYQGITLIHQGNNELLAQLSSTLNDNELNDYIVHPVILDGALQSTILLTGYQQSIPTVFEAVSIFSACKKEMFAWVRLSQDNEQDQTQVKLDIDLCDRDGNLCVQLQGVSYQQDSVDENTQLPTLEISSESKQITTQNTQNVVKKEVFTPVKISIIDVLPKDIQKLELQNTSVAPIISLSDPTAENSSSSQVKKAAIQLEDTNLHFSVKTNIAANTIIVNLYKLEDGIFSIEIVANKTNNLLSKDLIIQLLATFKKIQQQDLVKVVIVKGTELNFLHGNLQSYNDAIELKLFNAIISFPYPIIADMSGNASGVGLLFGSLCDFMICSEEGKYFYTNYQKDFYPSSAEFKIFEERFEAFRATDLLYCSIESTGKQLKEKGYTFPILLKADIEVFVQKLASNLSAKPKESLQLLKKHLSRKILNKVSDLDVLKPVVVTKEKGKGSNKISNSIKHINLTVHHKNILEVRMGLAKKEYGIKKLVTDLTKIFTQVNNTTLYKTIILTSEHQNFLPNIDEDVSVNDILSFQRLVFESKYPVIAVLNSNTIGLAWIMALFCDACIYNKESVYAVTNSWKSSELARQAAMILSYRFGNTFAKEILLSSDEFTGLELKKRAGIVNTTTKQTVLSAALQLSENWTKMPIETIISWKKQMVQSIQDRIKTLPAWSEPKEVEIKQNIDESVLISLDSDVIAATSHPEGILVVNMKDQEAKNMFSEAFEKGMIEVFKHIEKSQQYKVVILIGYDNYFASGGTKESLLAIQEGKVKFTDTKIFQLGMTCKLPVIAAMQGHGIGAGWSMGMFADFMLFSEESKYMSPYMNYGFTPGAGASYIFPEKMGYDLSRETMFTAQEFSGSELKDRGILIPVVPRKQVYNEALNLAREIAKYARTTLIAFKNQFTHQQLIDAEKVFESELKMHEKTFVGKSDTLQQILKNFDQGNAEKSSENVTNKKSDTASVIQSKETTQDIDILTEITNNLREILAQELHLDAYEIEDNIQFIDLGLDSITGVTWIRKINEIYKTKIEATKIYSYPTLAQLSQFVKEEADKLGVFEYLKEEDKIILPTIPVQETKNVIVENSRQQLDILPEVISMLRKILAEELHLQEHEIEENIQFIDLGLDSITGVTWIRKINEIYKTNIEATKIYSYPTLVQLSQFVKEEVEKQDTYVLKEEISVPIKVQNNFRKPTLLHKLVSRRKKSVIKTTTVSTEYQSEPIAIIGMSGQFPKAKNLEEFWENISQGKNCISEVPKERWDAKVFYKDGKPASGKTNSKWMGALEEYDLFDPLFFNISPTEAESMDPQQRVLLQSCWNSIENSGYNPKSLSGSKCGVYIGCASGDYHLLSRDLQISAQGFTGGATSVLAARISYLLNLQGPCLSIDTACSSSLVAITTACENLISRSCDLALAGGVYVMIGPDMHIKSAQSGMLSVDGKCYTFDNRANGFVPGEGVGVVMLKRLSDAVKDNDIIHGVIDGWGINQDGKTNGITAPNKESQVRLQQEVYDKFKIDPNSIQLIEAHGTGTKLGDPIEVEALNETFKKYTDKTAYCALGSVKSNIGHCLTAAGVAGFIKTLLALKHKQLPPTINYDHLNEHISLKESPFFINNKLQEWNVDNTTQRKAAISAFGFSGTNAHLVISEYETPQEVNKSVSVITQNSKLIVPISARTKDQLKQRVIDLISFVNNKEHSVELLSLAYTLQVGRQAMEERLCLLVSSTEELIEKLQAYCNDETHIRNLYQGQVKRNKESLSIINRDKELKATIIDNWIKQNKLSSLIDLWVKGMALDWNKLYGEYKPKRISLPEYPFGKERYWMEDAKSINGLKTAKVSVLHPLVHTNVSNLDQQCYHSTFTDDEFITKNYQVNGQKILPVFAQLEMAYEAVMHATSTEKNNIVVAMYNVVWNKPVLINNDKKVSIAIYDNDTDGIGYEIFSNEAQENLIYSEGEVFFSTENNIENRNISQLIASLDNSVFEKDVFYDALSKMSINIGVSLQGLTAIYSDSNQLLANINIPSTVASTINDYCLHPSIMDSVLQACLAFVLDLNNLPNQPLQPVALDFISIISKCTDKMYAYVRSSQEKPQENNHVKLDIDLCDEQGNICVIMQGLELAYTNILELNEEDSWDKTTYVYRWEELEVLKEKAVKNDHQSVLIVCSNSVNKFDTILKEHYAQKDNCELTVLHIANKTKQLSEMEWEYDSLNPDSLQECLQKTRKIDAFYFLAMKENNPKPFTYKELNDNQESNEIQLLRIIKNLKANNKISEKVDTYILTLDNYDVTQMSGGSFGAGVTGFAYSLAQGKYQFLVRNLDVSLADLKHKESQQKLIKTINNEPTSSRGEIIKLQSERRYKQEFLKLNWDASNKQTIRQDGVYLIVGGTGTVGKIISQHLIQKYNAEIIWLGRSANDSEKVQTALKSQKEFSDKVFYYETDVKSQQSMQRTIELIKNKFTQINGAIFAGMVFDFENSIDETTEEEFKSILETKTKGGWVFYNTLRKEALDFMCYFSSGQAYSFSGAAKLSAYATAITFADRMAQSFNKNSAFPVGIINWGFWKSTVNVLINEDDGVSTNNLDALEDSEGFACFEKFVNELVEKGRINQVLCMKVSEQMKSLINISSDEYIALANEECVCESLDMEIPRKKVDELIEAHKQNQLENWLAKLLFCEINKMVEQSGENYTIEELQKQCGISKKYKRWFNESLDMLTKHGFIQLKDGLIKNWKKIDINATLDEWKIQKDKYCEDIEFKSLVILLDDCLQKLSEIMQGKQLATDIIFPNSSMKKVEGIYKNNTTSDTFNEIVANSVVAYLQQKLKANPKSRLRILEIGAGTGGTSTIVFQKLKPFQKSIEKYCYTDLSKAFFFHAEKSYMSENPYIECQRLDIEKPIESQDIEIGSYDLVIATNVLHATKDIRNTLRNAKAALYKNGYIILNEMSDKSLTTHLTFGLLDGWWLFNDADLRIPNCPGLYPESWQRVLEEEGFTSVNFPVKDAHILGQQIILAKSNGVVQQKKTIEVVQKHTAKVQTVSRKVVQPKKLIKKTTTIVKTKVNVKEHITAIVLNGLSTTLKMNTDAIDSEIAFSDYGMDSILGVNFVNQVNDSLSISLNTAIIFEYSSTDKLSNHIFSVYNDEIEKQLNNQQEVSSVEVNGTEFKDWSVNGLKIKKKDHQRINSQSVSSRKRRKVIKETRSTDIAVIGMSGMMPKANSIEAFWSNIINGVDGVEELPKHYLDHDKYYSTEKKSGKTRCKWGGIVDERDCFDPLFFNLSPWEAESMNPHQRLVLQEGWKAIENSGYNPKNLSGSKTGVYIGVEPTGYQGDTFTGYSDAIISSRISYILNLKGPALSINTGCSSSGVALHLACESLRNKETNMSLVGGVNACMDYKVQVRLDEIDMLSPKGRCNTFDEGGSGTIISEGVGMVVLKRLEDAIADNDFICGVICGSGTNQDGASNGITAPNGAAQEELIVDVYHKFNIDPEDITYVEAHGTGTKLGDPIEANALVRAFKKFTIKHGYCAVGSAKSHIGHTGAAAGVTGLIKVLQSMKHNQIPKLLHFNKMNPLIEFDNSPFYIPTQATDWKANGKPLMAAINSFGHSGTNVHLVVKEFVSNINESNLANNQQQKDTVIIPLSAKTADQLKQKASDLLHFIQNHEAINLNSMAYTLQLGREAMNERLGFVVNSVEQLSEKLQAYLNDEQENGEFYQGHAKKDKKALSLFNENVDLQETLEKWIVTEKYERIVELWTKGLVFDWTVFYHNSSPKRMSLPSYPFDKERYWYTKSDSNNGSIDELLPSQEIEITDNMEAIENIINQIDNDSMEKDKALALLKNLV